MDNQIIHTVEDELAMKRVNYRRSHTQTRSSCRVPEDSHPQPQKAPAAGDLRRGLCWDRRELEGQDRALQAREGTLQGSVLTRG